MKKSIIFYGKINYLLLCLLFLGDMISRLIISSILNKL